MIEDALLAAEEGMEKALEATRREFGNIRTGRANPDMFNQILVDYYGAPTPLQQLASLQIPEARMVLISPYDRSAVPSAGPALPLAEADAAYTPAQPRVLPRLPAAAEPAVTAGDLNNLFSTLMGQRGVSQSYLLPQGYAVPTSSEVQVEEID